MDLSFARRQHRLKVSLRASSELARLLADASARQMDSPTARAQMQASEPQRSILVSHPEIARFAPKDAREASSSQAASFNCAIADTILTQSKPS